jgi:nicotinate-nucleotide pyrophosphorylase (carboxylating)
MEVETLSMMEKRLNMVISFYVSEGPQLESRELLGFKSMQRNERNCYKTKMFVDLIGGPKAKILISGKTTPGFRATEKWAVKLVVKS